MRKLLRCLFLCLLCMTAFASMAYAKDRTVTIPVTDEEGYEYEDSVRLHGISNLVQTTSTTSSVRLQWDYPWSFYGISDIYDTGYEVSYYNPADGSYTHARYVKDMNTTTALMKYTGTSTTGSSLKSGKTYYFAVRMYIKYQGTYYYGYYTRHKFAVRPKTTAINSLSSGTGKFTVKWDKVSSCDGYAIKYGTSSGLDPDYGTTRVVYYKGSDTLSKTFSNLPAGTYYVKVAAYTKEGSGKKILGSFSERKSIKITDGVSLKTMINAISTKDNTYAAAILEETDQSVDITKYSTTYEKFMAIYRWHAIHQAEFYNCLYCNYSFVYCIWNLFERPDDDYHRIWIDAGNYINNSGSMQEHKWAVIYFGCKAYIFDPRIEGKLNRNGTSYFGITKSSSTYTKHYDYEWHYGFF